VSPLKQFCRSYETQQAAAKALGISEVYMSQLVNGHYRPSLKIAERIEQVSEGRIKASAILWPESA
jgi:DNA-binding XRE family transcriptional regulator